MSGDRLRPSTEEFFAGLRKTEAIFAAIREQERRDTVTLHDDRGISRDGLDRTVVGCFRSAELTAVAVT
jgi:hypothetical protein